MTMTATEVQRWACPDCGLVIESIYFKQFEYNVSQHKKKHKAK